MPKEIDNRIRGTKWQAVYYEFLRSSFYFPLANILVEIILEGPKEVFESADFYGSICAALIQAWFLGYRQYNCRPLPFLGNLIGPALYTLLELIANPVGFFNVPFHLVYWTASILIGLIQQIRISVNGKFSTMLLLVESIVRSGILVVMFWFIERIVSPEYSELDHFLSDKPHVFIIVTLFFLAFITGLDEIRAERFLTMLKETANQLKQYSHWLFGRDMLSLAITNPDALTMARRERTVLFIDIRGFTEWSEHQTPELVVSMLNHYYDAGESILDGSRVIQTKYTADEIMAFFSSPEETVLVAQILSRVFASILHKYGLNVGIGIHTGQVVEGLLGSKELKRYDIIGDTVNTAKRICSAANGGELLISNEVYVQTSNKVIVSDKREISAKGKIMKLTVHSVLCPTVQIE